MYSTFLVSKSDCMTCNNQVMKILGKLQGIFGVEINRIEDQIVINHTDEVNREQIAKILESLGFPEKKEELVVEKDNSENIKPDKPSIWGCAL